MMDVFGGFQFDVSSGEAQCDVNGTSSDALYGFCYKCVIILDVNPGARFIASAFP